MSDRNDAAITVVPLGNGRYQVTQGARRHVAFAVAGRDTWVFLEGHTFIVSSPDDRPRRSRGVDHGALTAPMPATVLAINVAPGQQVAHNDVVMVLEAMKMELPIRSPRDGVVKTVGCAVGELVQPGATLIELEDEKIEP